ncbi:MAG: hypothetical protein JNK82_08820 [Myxococcaceae bacterium]|nr:hypothetical protein [Myxococcaceae bacterium]
MNLRIVVALVLVCSACGPRSAPPRTSPKPEVVLSGFDATPVIDALGEELAWYDWKAKRIDRVRGGVVERVADLEVDTLSRLRVFADNSFLVGQSEAILAFSASGAMTRIEVMAYDIDGVGIDDFWYLPVQSSGTSACRHLTGTTPDVCIAASEHSAGRLVVSGDGSVFVSTIGGSVFSPRNGVKRIKDGVVSDVASYRSGDVVSQFRKSGDTVWARVSDLHFGFIEVGTGEAKLLGRNVLDVRGTRDDYVYIQSDYETESDPSSSCSSVLLSPCGTKLKWVEQVVYRSNGGALTELGHDSCVSGATLCEPHEDVLGRSGGKVFLLEKQLRSLSE